MLMMPHVVRCLSALGLAAAAMGLEVDPVTFISPITGQSFDTHAVPISAITGDAMVDMGFDDDGCRHTSGTSEYQYYVTSDPYSYFTALTDEWNAKDGHFSGYLPSDIKDWTIKTFNSDWQIDHEREFKMAQEIARSRGQPPPDHASWVLPQEAIPLERRFRMALQCYEHRGARPAVLAKTALMGAWSLRCFLNLPIDHSVLLGGYDEVNDKIRPFVKDGETFELGKWLPIYRKIVNEEKLTNEGYMVAGLAYLGMAVREGDLAECQGILEKMGKRFLDVPDNTKSKPLMEGLIHEREHILSEYVTLEKIATDNLIQAIADEEFTRDDLVKSKLLVVAEGLRRSGQLDNAYEWYLTESKLIETQPELRSEMRAQGKAPAVDTPQAVQVAWMADLHLADLTKAGLVHGADVLGPQRALLNAIIFDGFGKADYINPNWKPATGASIHDCEYMLDLIGQNILVFNYQFGNWPDTLNAIWESQVMKDRNRVNRFYDPVKGQPFLYAPPKGTMKDIPPRTVLLCTAEPLTTNQGDVYLSYLANLKVVFSTSKPVPGAELVAKP
jgi:hypothetical protein